MNKVDIVENNDSKIKNISIYEQDEKSIKLYCKSYEDIESINFYFCHKINDLKNVFPIFNSENKKKCESLTSFYFDYENNDLDLNPIYNNISNMPNLQKFSLRCRFKNITKMFYEEFIMKLLDLKLNEINIEFTNYRGYDAYYSLDQLKRLTPKFIPPKNAKIKIKLYN